MNEMVGILLGIGVVFLVFFAFKDRIELFFNKGGRTTKTKEQIEAELKWLENQNNELSERNELIEKLKQARQKNKELKSGPKREQNYPSWGIPSQMGKSVFSDKEQSAFKTGGKQQ